MVHFDITSQYLVKKHKCWPCSTDGTVTHAYTHPLKAWSLGEWLMPTASTAVSTSSGADYCRRSLIDYMMLKRSPGPEVRGVPSSTIGLPEGSFLTDFVTEDSYPSRKMEPRGGVVL